MARRMDPATCRHDRRLAYTADDWRCMDCYYLHEGPDLVTRTVTVPADVAASLAAWVAAHGGSISGEVRGD